jgi:UDP-GlcNAc3NAcA epimerase
MPEEINRILTDAVSDLLFAPTDTAVRNLYKEGVPKQKIHKVGDVMFDAARSYGEVASIKSTILEELGLAKKRYILGTIHRAENTDDARRLRAIFGGLGRVSKVMPVVVPLHPRAGLALKKLDLLAGLPSRLRIVEPVGYLDMVMLEKNAQLIVTDSGGVQKEAFFHKVPCVTLRDETEWLELVQMGWNTAVSPKTEKIVADAIRDRLGKKGKRGFPYGYGDASQKIVALLKERIG